MGLKKLLVNDKITASYETDVSRIISNVTNIGSSHCLKFDKFRDTVPLNEQTVAGADPGLFTEGCTTKEWCN